MTHGLTRWLFALVTVVGSLAPQVARTQEAAPVRVVSTSSILDDLVRRVGGDRIASHVLVPPGGDSHAFAPTPADGAALVDAAVIFAIGLDFEPWLAGLVDSTGTGAAVVEVSTDVPLLTLAPPPGAAPADDARPAAPAADDEQAAAGGIGEFDPHIWHDVTNAIIMVENIRDALSAADPDYADTYRANAEAYIAELTALDSWVQEQINFLPADQRKLVTSHDSLGYFANRYGLSLVGTAFGSLSTEAGDPSAAQIAALVTAIQAEQVNAIFAENVSNPALMEAIAAEAGVALAPSLYTDALGEPGSGVETYVDLITFNTEQIVGALSGS